MNKIIMLLIFLFAAAVNGCNNKDMSKQQYYEKGIQYLQGGNPNGAIVAFKKAIEKDQSYFEARHQLGKAYILQGKYDSAEREFIKVLRLNPSFHIVHLDLAKTYINKLKTDDAIREIKIYFSKASDNIEANELAATAYAMKRDYVTAEEYLNSALKISPDKSSIKILLADIYFESGNIDKAEKVIKEVINSEEQNREALYVYIKIRQKQGKRSDVISAYQKIIELDPKDIRAQFELGLSYLENGNIVEAKKIAGKMNKSRTKGYEASYLTGVAFFQEKKIDDAIVSLQRSVSIQPNPGAHYYLGLCRFEKGDLQQAISEFHKVIDMKPNMIQPHLLLAAIHLKEGREEEAEKEIRTALTIDEKNAFAHNLLGSVYLAQNQGDLAIEEFDKAIELNPNLVEAHIKKGLYNLQSGNEQIAETAFVSAVKIAPDVLNSRILLAKYYIKQKRFKDAINKLKEGLKGDHKDAVIYNIMGAAYLGAEDINNSIQSFNKAISSDPKFLLSYFNLALLYLNKGEKEMAVKEYKKVLAVDKGNITALLFLAKVMEADKRDKEALFFYMQGIKTGKEIAYLSLAKYYQSKNDNDQAMKVLQEALKVDPRYAHAKKMMGLLYMDDKNYKEALSVYKDLKESVPEMGAEMIADVYAAMGAYDKALMEMQELLSKDDKRIDVLAKIVDLYIKKKDFEKAEKTAKNIISLKPQGDAGYLVLASVYMENQRFNDALNAAKKAQAINPDNIEIKTAIGRIYMYIKDFQRAFEIFRELEISNPKYMPAYFYQANIFEQINSKKDAIEKYKKLLELFPDYSPALNNLAYLYIEGYGPIDKAVELAQKAKNITPKDGSVTDTLGWALYHVGKYEDALKYLIEATHYLPGEPSVRYHLALTYLKLDMQDKAEEQFKNSIRLGRLSPFAEFKKVQGILAGIENK